MIDNHPRHERFIVEADRRVVGIAVRVPGGYRFFASDQAFAPAEAEIYRRARAVTHGIADLARRRRAAPIDAVTPPRLQ